MIESNRISCRESDKGFKEIFKQLDSADLHTRLAAVRIVNILVNNSSSHSQKESLMALLEENNVTLILQKSLGVTVPEVVKALRNYEIATGWSLTAVNMGKNLKNRLKELEQEVKVLQAEKEEKIANATPITRGSDNSLDLSALENEIGSLSFGSIDFSADFGEKFEFSEEISDNLEVDGRKGLTKSGQSRLSVMVGRSNAIIHTDGDAKDLHIECLETQLEDTKKELEEIKSKTISSIEVEKIQEELRVVKEENKVYQEKIESLSETVQSIIKDKTCEHCRINPELFHLDTSNKVRDSTVVIPLSARGKKTPINITHVEQATSDEVTSIQLQHSQLKEEIEDMQKRKYSVDTEKCKLVLEVERLQNEHKAMIEKKMKLSTAINSLQRKQFALVQECDLSKDTLARIKEEIKSQTVSDEVIKVQLSDCKTTSTNKETELELEQRMERMEALVTSLIQQKRSYKAQLEQLEKQLAEQSSY